MTYAERQLWRSFRAVTNWYQFYRFLAFGHTYYTPDAGPDVAQIERVRDQFAQFYKADPARGTASELSFLKVLKECRENADQREGFVDVEGSVSSSRA